MERIRSDSLYYGSAFELASLLSKVRFSKHNERAVGNARELFFPSRQAEVLFGK